MKNKKRNPNKKTNAATKNVAANTTQNPQQNRTRNQSAQQPTQQNRTRNKPQNQNSQQTKKQNHPQKQNPKQTKARNPQQSKPKNKSNNQNQQHNKARNKKHNQNHQTRQKGKNINPISERDTQLRGNAQRRKKRSKLKRTTTSAILIVVIVATAIILSLTVFFHISQITVDGNVRYKDDEILSVVPLKIEDNLILCDLAKVEQDILKAFPYVGKVEVKRQLPSTVSIKITEAQVAYSLQSADGKYTLIDLNGRVLEEKAIIAPKNSFIIKGVKPVINRMEKQWYLPGVFIREKGIAPLTNIVGKTVVFSDDTVLPTISKLVSAIQNSGIFVEQHIGELTPNSQKGEIKSIDLTDIINIKLNYNDSLVLKLGTILDVDYKLKFAKETIDKLPLGAKGTIDLSSDKNATYSPKV